MAKRGTDHLWEFVKYSGDGCYYARCRCGFRFSCCKQGWPTSLKWEPAPEHLYRYCPNCGARKKRYKNEGIYIEGFPWGKLPEWDDDE